MKKFFVMALLVFSMSASAYEVKDICVKYRLDNSAIPSWSQGYQVQGHILDGHELSQKTKCAGCYNPSDKYVVVFWGDGQATVIDTDTPFLSVYTEGRDQQGRVWEISDSSALCY